MFNGSAPHANPAAPAAPPQGAIPIVAECDGRGHYAILHSNGGVRLAAPRPEDELPEGMAYYPGTAYRLATGRSGPPSRWKYFDEQAGRWRSIKELPRYEEMIDGLDAISEQHPYWKRRIVYDRPLARGR